MEDGDDQVVLEVWFVYLKEKHRLVHMHGYFLLKAIHSNNDNIFSYLSEFRTIRIMDGSKPRQKKIDLKLLAFYKL